MNKFGSLEKDLSLTANAFKLDVAFFGEFILEESVQKIMSWKFEFSEKAVLMLSDGDRRAQAIDEHIAFLKYKYKDFGLCGSE